MAIDSSPRRGMTASLAVVALLAIAGCANVQQPLQSDLASSAGDVKQCAAWFERLDATVDQAGVRDAEAYPLPGFPHLRVNRFLASFAPQAKDNPAALAEWERQMRALDARTRGYEISNLPTDALARLGAADRGVAIRQTDHCGEVLMQRDLADASRQALVAQQAQVPDDYADWKRVVGLYPLVKLPFYQFAQGWQNEAETMFQQAAAGNAPQHNLQLYRPVARGTDAAGATRIVTATRRDVLGIPQYSDADAQALIDTFAPVFQVDTTDSFDQPGALHWAGAETPQVDTAHPTVYTRVAFTRYRGQTLTQLVYLLWFSERPLNGWADLVGGKLDGLIFRVTLDEHGQPLIYDTIHPCGCYHMFFPTPAATPVPSPNSVEEWAFIPRNAPAVTAPQRILVRLTSRDHYVTDLRVAAAGDNVGIPYVLTDDGILRVLPTAQGTKSIFGTTGIVAGTDRGERMFTWALGLEDAGAMREWGRHATALVGRRHFDDADLIDKRFDIPSLVGGQSTKTRNGG